MPIPPDIPDIGDVVILEVTFTDRAGDPTNPTAVTCSVLLPDTTETSLTPTNTGTGTYESEFSPTLSGTHWFRYMGTGAITAAGEMRFHVAQRHVP